MSEAAKRAARMRFKRRLANPRRAPPLVREKLLEQKGDVLACWLACGEPDGEAWAAVLKKFKVTERQVQQKSTTYKLLTRGQLLQQYCGDEARVVFNPTCTHVFFPRCRACACCCRLQWTRSSLPRRRKGSTKHVPIAQTFACTKSGLALPSTKSKKRRRRRSWKSIRSLGQRKMSEQCWRRLWSLSSFPLALLRRLRQRRAPLGRRQRRRT